MRNVRDRLPKPLVTSARRSCASRNASPSTAQRSAMRRRRPRACTTMALRSAVSATTCRAPATATRRVVGLRVSTSVASVSRQSRMAPTKHSDADPGMEQKAQPDIERHPGQIEQCGESDAGHEGPQGLDVPKRLHAVRRLAGAQSRLQHDVERPVADLLVPGAPDARENAGAQAHP